MLLRAEDLWFGYEPSRYVLRGASVQLEKGSVHMVLGKSGSGKTTLLKVLKGILRPSRGEVFVLGRPLLSDSMGRGAGQLLAYIPQGLGVVSNLSVIQNVLIGCLARAPLIPSLLGQFPRDEVRKAHDILERLGLSEKAQERVARLSGGQRQRVAIARALMQDPSVILADEFISQLDPVTAIEVMNLVKQLAAEGLGLMITTHDIHLVPRYADHVSILKEGRMIYGGEASGVSQDILLGMLR